MYTSLTARPKLRLLALCVQMCDHVLKLRSEAQDDVPIEIVSLLPSEGTAIELHSAATMPSVPSQS